MTHRDRDGVNFQKNVLFKLCKFSKIFEVFPFPELKCSNKKILDSILFGENYFINFDT